ncbi:MAG: FAD-binding oxidoreductase [Acidobacteria bacterium]|nr:FAD-binding oxidoreductase [Acidobacteriota bacterium]
MSNSSPKIVICGAGMAGLSAAYHLVVKQKQKNVTIIDELNPLSLTSDKGTQAYRNWWPGPDDTMVKFINRSIDLIDELALENNNFFNLNRRGYLFLTAEQTHLAQWKKSALEISKLGTGDFREHTQENSYLSTITSSFDKNLTGADLILNPEIITKKYPFLTKNIVGGLHVRRAGWMESVKLGHWLKDEVIKAGTKILLDKLESVKIINNSISSIKLSSGKVLDIDILVLAVGPHLKATGRLLGLDLPVFNELHGKITLSDTANTFSSEAPLMIWDDPLYLPWEKDQIDLFNKDASTQRLLEKFPTGVHLRPKGDKNNLELMIIWTYEHKTQDEFSPISFDPYYKEILIRGLSKMIPKLSSYFGKSDKAYLDGGYYCKTPENRPLIGPLPINGAYIIGALSGYGIMASQAAGELLAAHIAGSKLPDYTSNFLLERYKDANYQTLVQNINSLAGQL